MKHDLHSDINYARGISPVAGAANDTPFVSQIIDTQGYEANEFIILLGALPDVDATFVVLVEDGDDSGLSDNAPVVDLDLIGTEAEATFLFSSDDETRKIGYKGNKRYVRVTITPAANTGVNLIAGLWVQARKRHGA